MGVCYTVEVKIDHVWQLAYATCDIVNAKGMYYEYNNTGTETQLLRWERNIATIVLTNTQQTV